MQIPINELVEHRIKQIELYLTPPPSDPETLTKIKEALHRAYKASNNKSTDDRVFMEIYFDLDDWLPQRAQI
jgi:hypothetical protein